ncbi:MAG: DUF192 domain-containing protein [Planctomycetes bacterium]|nr:DUF192 domain-containing protein [Planctomycetota bacterium]MCK5578319.1 DUF192 domain-containing protein [Planctomycetota bacterium]
MNIKKIWFILIPLAIVIVIGAYLVLIPPKPTPPQQTPVILRINQHELQIEVVFTPQTRAKGLMNRPSLPENNGMLFIYPNEQPLSFWMKNTRIPLAIAFIKADHTIIQIESMKPFDANSTVSKKPVKYALEVNDGWFKKHRIKVGNRVELPGYITYLRAE